MNTFDLVIEAAHVLTMKNGQGEVLTNAMVGVNKNRIAYVGPKIAFQAAKTIQAHNHILMPGLINAHTHLAMTLFRGMGEDLALQTWLEKVIFPMEASQVNDDFVRRGTELAIKESLQYGVTTFCDMYYFSHQVADVIDQAGLRILVGQAFSDYPAPDDKNLSGQNYKTLESLMEKYSDNDRITPTLAPHAPYTCSDELLKKAAAFADKHSLPISIHVSETRFEVENSYKQYGKSPVQRMSDLGIMNQRSIFAHAVHLSPADMDLVQKHGTGLVHNPESNMKLASGVAPIREYLKRGIAIGLGTDGAASNNNLNMFQEMDTAAKLQKMHCEDPTAITAAQVLRLATYDGARALGLGKDLGSLEVGKLADMICVDLKWPNMQPLSDVCSQLVYSTNGNEVSHVICDGKVIVG